MRGLSSRIEHNSQPKSVQANPSRVFFLPTLFLLHCLFAMTVFAFPSFLFLHRFPHSLSSFHLDFAHLLISLIFHIWASFHPAPFSLLLPQGA